MDAIGTLDAVKKIGQDWVNDQRKKPPKKTSPGSLKWLFWGSQPSEQSIVIKAGKLGETLAKAMIQLMGLHLLLCGPQVVNEKGKKKDIDLIWTNEATKTLYIRELKGNIELDSEKLPATFEKIPAIFLPWLEKCYPGYKIDIGILNWSVYDRSDLSVGLSHIKRCEKAGVKVEHFGDFCKLIDFKWEKHDFYLYFRERGAELRTIFD